MSGIIASPVSLSACMSHSGKGGWNAAIAKPATVANTIGFRSSRPNFA